MSSGITDGRHALAEETSLELHRAVADRLRAEASRIGKARERVARWLEDGSVPRAVAEAWNEMLEQPLERVVVALTDPGERARQLRQTSPFAGLLDARTRWEIWRRVRQVRRPA